jgi:hypothetical protein
VRDKVLSFDEGTLNRKLFTGNREEIRSYESEKCDIMDENINISRSQEIWDNYGGDCRVNS